MKSDQFGTATEQTRWVVLWQSARQRVAPNPTQSCAQCGASRPTSRTGLKCERYNFATAPGAICTRFYPIIVPSDASSDQLVAALRQSALRQRRHSDEC